MPTQEIKDTNWEKFCEGFERAHRDGLITLEVMKHDGTSELLAENEPLRGFRFQKTDGCSDLIQIDVGATQHQVVEPLHVRLRDSQGAQNVLEIDAESGAVQMRFSSGRVAALLNELSIH